MVVLFRGNSFSDHGGDKHDEGDKNDKDVHVIKILLKLDSLNVNSSLVDELIIDSKSHVAIRSAIHILTAAHFFFGWNPMYPRSCTGAL